MDDFVISTETMAPPTMVHAAHVNALVGDQITLTEDLVVHLVMVVAFSDELAARLAVAALEEDLMAGSVVHLAITFPDDLAVHHVEDSMEDLAAHQTIILSVNVEALDVIILIIFFVDALHPAMILIVAHQETV